MFENMMRFQKFYGPDDGSQGAGTGTQEPTTDPETEPQSEPTVTITPEEALKILDNADDAALLGNAKVKALLEKVRKQEKDKLYKTVEAKQKAADERQAQIDALTRQLEEKDSASLTEQEKTQKELQKLSENLAKLEKQARAAELKAYKAEQLRKAGSELISELVGGNSEEEIDQSIEFAKAKYQEILQQAEEKVKASTPRPKQTVPATNPASQVTTGGAKFTADDIRNWTAEDYKKHRDVLIKNPHLIEG